MSSSVGGEFTVRRKKGTKAPDRLPKKQAERQPTMLDMPTTNSLQVK